MRGLLLFLALTISACTGAYHVKPYTSTSKFHADTEDVIRINAYADQLHKQFIRAGLLYSDIESNQYISNLGARLTPDFMKPGVNIKFYIFKDATANAMALANGNIYINIGLLSAVENEDQLASIIAHEISHVVQRDPLKSMINQHETIFAANIADIFLLGTGLGYLPAISHLSSFSQQQEKHADLNGLEYLKSSGFDPHQASRVFEVIHELPESMTLKYSAYSSHPDNLERSQYLKNVINEKYPATPRHGSNSPEFAATRKKVVEKNVQIRLQQHQYELALYTLNKSEEYYNRAALIQYYRGEVHRLKAKNPEQAAAEIEWLMKNESGNFDVTYFTENKQDNINQAISYYKDAKKLNPKLPHPYKGLGLIYYSNEQYDKAQYELNNYLKLSYKPVDGLYVKRLIRNINRK